MNDYEPPTPPPLDPKDRTGEIARRRAEAVVQEWNRQMRGELARTWSLTDLVTDIAHEIRRAWAEGLQR